MNQSRYDRQQENDLLGPSGGLESWKKMGIKDERIGIRVPREIKVALQNIAKKEGRSLAQVCELLLKGGILEYERTGPDYLRRLLMRTGARSK